MIDRDALLADLKKRVPGLEADLREHIDETPALGERLAAEHRRAAAGRRTGLGFESFKDEAITQAAVAWVLTTVFVRFLEDNRLIDRPRLSGPGERRALALDSRTAHKKAHPTHSDRDYLEATFRELASLPGCAALFDARHNALWTLPLSVDGARDLVEGWLEKDPETGATRFDFTDPGLDTRFLGDLYQDLSEAARKRYALLQTPEFVERFILDRTLEPAIREFGLAAVQLIDPTCGSGHFLIGAFTRLFGHWQRQEPLTNPTALAQRALDGVHGIDLNPFAVAIARFRLLLAATGASGVKTLAQAPDFKLNLATGDSLLFGPMSHQAKLGGFVPQFDTLLAVEDRAELEAIARKRYHVVVGNPPYITVKDPVLNQAYRERYTTCSGKYALSVPFLEAFFGFAEATNFGKGAGYVGTITANSFMKRNFGKSLIERWLPSVDLTTVIDTSGAYIPGHGTPTVILFGRRRDPLETSVRVVQGIRGEPATPEDPAKGQVWSSILKLVDQPGTQNEYVSVADTPRDRLRTHPWSLAGGGADDVKAQIEGEFPTLGSIIADLGRTTHTGEDGVFFLPSSSARTFGFIDQSVPMVMGEDIRDFSVRPNLITLFPYDIATAEPLGTITGRLARHFWTYRTSLRARVDFGRTLEERGMSWWEHSMFFPERFRVPCSITFAEVATHNHFVLDRGGKVFKQTAPVIKLPAGASEDEHLGLLGLLNSSTACFWLKQVAHCKGSTVDQHGARQRTAPFEDFYQVDGTKAKMFPVAEGRPLDLSHRLDALAQACAVVQPDALCRTGTPSRESLTRAEADAISLRRKMIALQEELDWECYRLYGLHDESLTFPPEDLPELALGERAFEIVLARKLAAGDETSAWFTRHGSTPLTEVPPHWPPAYRALVERRLKAIEDNPNLALIERPECKRRWNDEPWASKVETALRGWLLDRLEAPGLWNPPALMSTARLADRIREDPEFLQVAALYRGRDDFELAALVEELAMAEAVPFHSALRYSEDGLRKRRQWEATWDLQRREDAGEAVGPIPVPPKYASGDFQSSTYWQLRGKLDVPKERFLSYPGAGRDSDPSPVIGWAGWNHAEQAQALAATLVSRREDDAWSAERLTPLAAGLLELLPWLTQWHAAVDPRYGESPARIYADFLDNESRTLGLSPAALAAWRPPAKPKSRRGPKKKPAPAESVE